MNIGHAIEQVSTVAGLACGLAMFAQGAAVPDVPTSMPTTIGAAFITIAVMMCSVNIWAFNRKFDENDRQREADERKLDKVLATFAASLDKVVVAFASSQKDGQAHDEKEREQVAANWDRERVQRTSDHKEVVTLLHEISDHFKRRP